MCGIAGFLGTVISPRAAVRAAAALAHRGPEDQGVWESAFGDYRLTLVHRRLRILDLSDAGHQPMLWDQGRLAVVFNGEIYNFQELRRLLQQEGFRFRSGSDTEVILAAWDRWGIESIPRLHGMFAFALWDAARGELILARDRLGKKPLFYRQAGEQFSFASEIKALLAGLDKVPPVDEQALDDYLTYLYIPYPKTIFSGIRQLPPATWMRLRVQGGRLSAETERYWEPLRAAVAVPRSFGDLRVHLQELISETVRARLTSDVPLGVLLSGGIDSSTITAIMAGTSTQPVRSFSVGFRNHPSYDETEYAAAVARRYGCDHQLLEAEPACSRHLARIVWHFDQPFGNPTAVLTYLLSELTRRRVTVALAGDGGDEVFGGYPRYIGAYLSGLPRALPGFLRSGLLPWIGRRISDSTDGRHQFRRLREFLENSGRPLIEMYLRWVGYFSPEQKRELYRPETLARLEGYDAGSFLRGLWRDSEGLEPLNRLAYVDVKSFLCSNILEYADRMAMAHALELRAPFTDHRLVEFSLRTPFAFKFRYGESKWLLKRAVGPLLPREVLEKRKLGFNPPVGAWLQQELSRLPEELLGSRRLLERGLFQPRAVERLLEAHRTNRRDYALQIWALLILEIWFRLYVDGASVDTVQEEIDRSADASSSSAGASAGRSFQQAVS